MTSMSLFPRVTIPCRELYQQFQGQYPTLRPHFVKCLITTLLASARIYKRRLGSRTHRTYVYDLTFTVFAQYSFPTVRSTVQHRPDESRTDETDQIPLSLCDPQR